MAMTARVGSKALTAELRKLAAQVHTALDDGTPVTKEQALADLIWKMALGYEELTKDDNGRAIRKTHAPVAWAMQYLFERIEGKAPIASGDNESGMKASEKVSELARQRINALTKSKVGPPVRKPK